MENPGQARKVGLFVVVALVLLAMLILNFSKGASLWTPTVHFTVESQNVGGLKPGAHVLMSGVPVGLVESIDLGADGRKVLILCRIEKRFGIHRDAHWEIEQSGFLGDQYVSVVPTLNEGPYLEDGANVRAQAPFNMQEAARSAVGLMQRLDSTAGKIDTAVARVDRMLLSEATLSDLTNSIASLRKLSDKADMALSDVRQLVRSNSPAIAGTLSNLTEFSRHLTTVATNLNSVIDANKGSLQASLANLQTVASDAKGLVSDLQAGRGVAGRLLKDETLQLQAGDMMSNLVVLSSNLSRHGILWKPRTLGPLTNSTRYSGRTPFR
ncbi:MAG: MCE family protein [Verrucomicrobia bacterium]|nr:MAG: MCE family protein [Verrucomicrobiota bacterium]